MTETTWLRLKIYTPTQVLIGYAYYPHQQRLLDLLNGVSVGALESRAEFLPLSEVTVHSPGGGEEAVPISFVNKANIHLVRALDEDRVRGHAGKTGHKPYPFIEKLSIAVALHLPSYTLTAQMHCAKGERVWDVLNIGPRFLPLTNVEICPSTGSSESGVSFVAVNKGQILSLEEVGIPLMESHPKQL